MDEISRLDYLIEVGSAVGSIATPFILLIVGFIIWKYQKSIERSIKLEEQLRSDRVEIYNQILAPYTILLMSDKAWASNPRNKNKDKFKEATSLLLSLEYRKVSFRLSLIGSDAVVLSFNNLMQLAYQSSEATQRTPSHTNDMITSLGNLLLEIRRSMGNEKTKIDNIGMLEWFISDAKKYRTGS